MRPISDWSKESLCRGHADSEFFTSVGVNPTGARKLCPTCPVQVECLNYAIIYDECGVWGGTTESERKALKFLKPKLIAEAKALNLYETRVSIDEPLHMSLVDIILARHQSLKLGRSGWRTTPVGGFSIDFGPILPAFTLD